MPLNIVKKLHIISFNVPFPADYGGVIGVYYHLEALAELGVEITLHCYQYGREEAKELEQFCRKVYYYNRDMSLRNLASTLPFIVTTRRHPKLLERLLEDDTPILFEGTHCCYFLNHPKLADRLKVVRMHNVEWEYYANMVPMENDTKKKLYFKWESGKLKHFELNTLKEHANAILAVSPADTAYFKEQGFKHVHYVPAFHPNKSVACLEGRGDYVLFHGDLSVKENDLIAKELMKEIFSELTDVPFIIAGRQAGEDLKKMIHQYPNVSLRENVPQAEMEQLIQEAHIHLLRAFQPAGMKLKLLNALHKGRFLIVNSHMVKNTGLDHLCEIIENIKDVPNAIKNRMKIDFDKKEIQARKEMLDGRFSNLENAKVMYDLMK